MKTIYTERKNEKNILAWCQEYFNSYEIQKAIGIWEGRTEKSIKISGREKRSGDIKKLAEVINARNGQDCCLVTGTGNDKILYRIYAEHEKTKAIRRVISKYFKGYTYIKQMGQIIFEIISEGYNDKFAKALLKTGQVAIPQIVKATLI